MNFLKNAEQYAENHNDEAWFKEIYTQFREYNGVRDSVWKTLNYLYGEKVANNLTAINNIID